MKYINKNGNTIEMQSKLKGGGWEEYTAEVEKETAGTDSGKENGNSDEQNPDDGEDE